MAGMRRTVTPGAVSTSTGGGAEPPRPTPSPALSRQRGVVTLLGPGHPLFTPGTPGFYRFLILGLATAYIVGFHVTLGRTRIGIGPR